MTIFIAAYLILGISDGYAQQVNPNQKFNSRIDNIGYWKKVAEKGLVPLTPFIPVKPAVYTGNEILSPLVITENSPDVAVTEDENVWESENSSFINPVNNDFILNSNNSTGTDGSTATSLYGACSLFSQDAGLSWGGSYEGVGGDNMGDPTTAINLDGSRMYVNFIKDGGQSVAYSTDGGNTWETVVIATVPNPQWDVLDKNHMWIDNCPSSPYKGNLYVAWTPFTNASYGDIELSYSSDGGLTWSDPSDISSELAGFHQGVNISTGPNGEVYVIWSVYEGSQQSEKAIGFTKSTDGGGTFETPVKIIDNINGVRDQNIGKNMRLNSFPVITVDISGGDYNGNLYVVWTNLGVPGTNTGDDADVYMIRSEDIGTTWSAPLRINQDTPGLGKAHFSPWITCDPETGYLSAVFYDDRNVESDQCEVYCANSIDAGETWEDFKVSDVAFTPSPIPGLVGNYMGDYLSITARGGKVYPVWTDNRDGFMTWVSPYEINTLPKPKNLTLDLDDETGEVAMAWEFEEKAFLNFNIYRDNELIGTSTETSYTDNLPGYSIYSYSVTAVHDEGESSSVNGNITWGSPEITLNPDAITETLLPNGNSVKNLIINNFGQIDLNYSISVEENKDIPGDITWVLVVPDNGIVESGSKDTVLVKFNATGLEEGIYTANLKITSNDPDNSVITIPVTLSIIITEVNEDSADAKLNIYPNPTSGIISCEFYLAEKDFVDFSVYSINGKKVYEQKNIPVFGKYRSTIDLSDFPNGVYFARIFKNGINNMVKFIIRK